MTNLFIDLRSDTVTRPSPRMRKAMAEAEVGDMQYDDDPSLNRLERRVAELLGKEAALWVPSGTMANQVALLTLTRPGDDVIVGRESHAVWHEAGGGGANAGVQFTEIGSGGLFTADDFVAAIKPRNGLSAPTALVQIENTHNRMGGVIWPQAEVVRVCAAARERGIASYLDGARLWNVAAETGAPVAELARPFDLLMVAMSKGLGAPGGSLLAGPKDLIAAAVRHRRRLGGAMRQVGFFAAAAEYALDHNLARLKEDHEAARMLGAMLAASPRIRILAQPIQTNIIVIDLADGAPPAATIVDEARRRGVLVNALGPRKMRALTHLDVSSEDCARAGQILLAIVGG